MVDEKSRREVEVTNDYSPRSNSKSFLMRSMLVPWSITIPSKDFLNSPKSMDLCIKVK